MKTHSKLKLGIPTTIFLILLFFAPDIIQAQAGHMHRATRRRTAVVVSSATHANDQQQAQAAAQTPPPEQSAPAPAAAPAVTTPPPASTQALLPIGTVASALPAGCVSKPVGGIQYYECGANYYQAAYQAGTLVYVTVKPPQ